MSLDLGVMEVLLGSILITLLHLEYKIGGYEAAVRILALAVNEAREKLGLNHIEV